MYTYFYGFVLIKSGKNMHICDYVIFGIGTFKNLFFNIKKEYKRLNAAKHTAEIIYPK